MTTQDVSRDQLIELVTREVLTALAERADICANPTKLREVVANGADRVSFHGVADDVPLDLAKYIDHTLLRQTSQAMRSMCCAGKLLTTDLHQCASTRTG